LFWSVMKGYSYDLEILSLLPKTLLFSINGSTI
jgi:hypothetical protein